MKIKVKTKDVRNLYGMIALLITTVVEAVFNGIIWKKQKDYCKKAEKRYGQLNFCFIKDQTNKYNKNDEQKDNLEEYYSHKRGGGFKSIEMEFGGNLGKIRLCSAAMYGLIWTKIEIITALLIIDITELIDNGRNTRVKKWKLVLKRIMLIIIWIMAGNYYVVRDYANAKYWILCQKGVENYYEIKDKAYKICSTTIAALLKLHKKQCIVKMMNEAIMLNEHINCTISFIVIFCTFVLYKHALYLWGYQTGSLGVGKWDSLKLN